MAEINKRIGERIKSIRQQKMMTQKELCGSQITRNMLSCIENGMANPSIKTLEYIAERLNVPAGILISEDEGNFTLKKSSSIDNIRQAYKNGAYLICIDICRSLGETDDEISMIMSHAYMGCARSAFNDGNLKSMCDYIDEAMSYTEKTMYADESIEAEASCYFRFASEIIPNLSVSASLQSRKWSDDLAAFNNEFCRYAYILECTKNGADQSIFPMAFKNQTYKRHIEAVQLINSEEYGKALDIFKELIYGSALFELPIMYVILRGAELCAKNVDDYKLAYEFSTSAISVLDNMIR